jgi:hypothetical protein
MQKFHGLLMINYPYTKALLVYFYRLAEGLNSLQIIVILKETPSNTTAYQGIKSRFKAI